MTIDLRWRTLATVTLLAGLLGGCVVSQKPLFEANTAVTPAVPGRYEAINNSNEGLYGVSLSGTLSLDGKTYNWKKDNGSEETFMAFDLGDGLFVAAAESAKAVKVSATYVLFKKMSDGFLYYEVVCQNIQKLGLPKKSRPAQTRIEKPVLQCIYDQRENMISALRLYARRFSPSARIMLVKP